MADPGSVGCPFRCIDADLVQRVLAANPRCQRLNLTNNSIAFVDGSVAGLSETLRALDLSHNKLRVLGHEFGLLTHLRTLIASGNLIEDVSGLAHCARLQQVWYKT